MKTSPPDLFAEFENKVSAKLYLEFAVHLIELGFFESIVFCHDNVWFDSKKYAQVTFGFLNLLMYLDSCGIRVETNVDEAPDTVKALYSGIMRDSDRPDMVVCYELCDIDFTNMNTENAVIPDNCTGEDFSLVKLYLILKTGAALNKKAIENIVGRNFTDSGMLALRKRLEIITGHEIKKRDDNSYEMR